MSVCILQYVHFVQSNAMERVDLSAARQLRFLDLGDNRLIGFYSWPLSLFLSPRAVSF